MWGELASNDIELIGDSKSTCKVTLFSGLSSSHGFSSHYPHMPAAKFICISLQNCADDIAAPPSPKSYLLHGSPSLEQPHIGGQFPPGKSRKRAHPESHLEDFPALAAHINSSAAFGGQNLRPAKSSKVCLFCSWIWLWLHAPSPKAGLDFNLSKLG